MQIPINVRADDFFSYYVSILNPLLNLRKREADVLVAFLRVYYANRHLTTVNQLLFSFSSLKSIREHLKMSVPSFNNHKHILRKKKVFVGNSINPLITSNVPKNGKLEISFNLSIIPNARFKDLKPEDRETKLAINDRP